MSATTQEIRAIFDESRNGANEFYRHPLARRFIYTDGVKEVAEKAGAYWLLDIIGTEFVPAYLKATDPGMGIIEMFVTNGKAKIILTTDDDAPPVHTRKIEYTDFPDGKWVFYLASDDGQSCTLILPSEH